MTITNHHDVAPARSTRGSGVNGPPKRGRRFAGLLTLFVTISSSLVVGPGVSAFAGQNDGVCNSNELCVFSNANYGIPRSDFLYYYSDMSGGIDFHTYNYPSTCNNISAPYCVLNDSISSAQNLSDHRSVRLFTNAHYDGNFQTLRIGVSSSQVIYNDQTSSECWNDGGISFGTDPDCTFSN